MNAKSTKILRYLCVCPVVSDSILPNVPIGHVLLTIDGQDWTHVPGGEETVVEKFRTAPLPMRMVFAYPKPDATLLFRRGDSPRNRAESDTLSRYRSDSATSARSGSGHDHNGKRAINVGSVGGSKSSDAVPIEVTSIINHNTIARYKYTPHT